MVGQFIDTFWRKSFIGHLRRARKISEEEQIWTLTYKNKTHHFQYVWLQGLCVKTEKNADRMIIEDATGQADIQNCSRIPDVWLINEGDYVMIAGRLLQNNLLNDRILIDAYRIQSLKMNSKSEISWPFELIDISENVYHFI